MKSLVIDVTKCIGCYNCQVACKDEHVGNDWMPYTKPQPESGHFWIKVNETERGTIPKLKVDWIPMICMHCEDAPCAEACGEHAIYTRDDGIVVIDPGKCKGTRKCIDACPYGVIYFNEGLRIAQKCTMCAHLLDEGWEEPRCVRACPTGALVYGELEGLIDRAEIFTPEKEPAPKVRVFYIGLPRRFIAGEVYCPGEDKCIDQAEVTLTDMSTGEEFFTKTNNYGDFWLEGLDSGLYRLSIEKEGYYSKEINAISTDKDVNLGEIKLYKRV
jgi:Fe-S-cluster-containing dehydrogenase component